MRVREFQLNFKYAQEIEMRPVALMVYELHSLLCYQQHAYDTYSKHMYCTD